MSELIVVRIAMPSLTVPYDLVVLIKANLLSVFIHICLTVKPYMYQSNLFRPDRQQTKSGMRHQAG